MGTIHQPKPSEPKSPSPDQRPLQPGGVDASTNAAPATRVNPQAPEILRDELDEAEEAARRVQRKQ